MHLACSSPSSCEDWPARRRRFRLPQEIRQVRDAAVARTGTHAALIAGLEFGSVVRAVHVLGVGRLGGAVGVEFSPVLGEVGGCGAGKDVGVGVVVGVGDGVEGWELWGGGSGGGGGGGFWWGRLVAASLGGRG